MYNTLSHTILKVVDFSQANNTVHLVVDLCKAQKERKIFNQHLIHNLENELPTETKLDIKHENSQNNFGLQAADLFCSGIARKYQFNDTEWYECFADRIKEEIHWLANLK